MRTTGHAQTSLHDDTRQLTAFHLPEVCRQMYCDTATLAYQRHTFMVDDYDMGDKDELLSSLLPAQRNAITAMAPASPFFESYISDPDSHRKAFRRSFPNLERIVVPSDALELIIVFNKSGGKDRTGWTTENWQQWVVERVEKTEGEDIKVVFDEAQ